MSVKDKNRITAAVIALVVIVVLILIKKLAEGRIDSVEALQSYMLTFGIFAPLVLVLMFPKKEYDKWSVKIKKSRSYGVFLFIATLLPLFPDDFLCYFSGLVKMEKKKFIWIILLGKPWCILAYSYAFGLI